MIVGTTPMIAIPVAAFMGSVAMIVGPAPQARCNDFGRGRPMIAIPAADDCGSLQVLGRQRGRTAQVSGTLSGQQSGYPATNELLLAV